MVVFPRYCAPQKVQTGSAAAGGHRRVATRTSDDLTARRGAGEPVRRAEWMTVLRYGHLRSALVVVDACLRTEREPHDSTRPSGRLLDGLLPLPNEEITSAQPRRICVDARFSFVTRPLLLLVLSGSEVSRRSSEIAARSRSGDQEPVSRHLRAVCATDHGQRAGLRAVLVIAPPEVSVVDKLCRTLSENTVICAVFSARKGCARRCANLSRCTGSLVQPETQVAAKLRG